jgi:phosphoribosylglycinamide formyltransferase-1
MNDIVRIAVLASGRGSNFRAINEALAAHPDPPAEIVLCLSNNPEPGAFDYAREHGIETRQLTPRKFDSDTAYERALLDLLADRRIDMIVLAGYMRLIPAGVVEAYRGRILNIHPALLPEFGGHGMYGPNVHTAVIASGKRESGATVHLVDPEYDSGAVLAQERIPVLADDTPETLAERVLAVEHRLYPRVVVDMARTILKERRGADESGQGS